MFSNVKIPKFIASQVNLKEAKLFIGLREADFSFRQIGKCTKRNIITVEMLSSVV